MKRIKILIGVVVLLSIILFGYISNKLILIESIKNLQQSENLKNMPLYIIKEGKNTNQNFTFDKHDFVMPEYINYVENDCTVAELGNYVCKDADGEVYFAVLKGDNDEKMALQIYALNLAVLNVDLSEYSLSTSIKDLEKIKSLSLIRKVAVVRNLRFITAGTRAVTVSELVDDNKYVIDVFGASSIIFKSSKKLTDEELLDFIKTMNMTSSYITEQIGNISSDIFSVDDSYELIKKIYGTDDLKNLFTMYSID